VRESKLVAGGEQTRGVKHILERGYDQKTFERDIAVLVLSQPLQFDKVRVAPVCLPDAGFAYDGAAGVITGWGRLKEAGNLPATLQVVSVPLLSHDQCRKFYEKVGYGDNVKECHICSRSDRQVVDSCQVRIGRRWMLKKVIIRASVLWGNYFSILDVVR